MELTTRKDLELMNRFLDLNISHVARAEFAWHGRNRLPLNRLFIVVGSSGTEKAFIRNHTGNEFFELHPGYVYLMPRDLDLEFNFVSGMLFYALHFSLELFHGFDIFAGDMHCKSRNDTFFLDSLMEIFNGSSGIKSLCLLKGLALYIAGSFYANNLEGLEKLILLNGKYGTILDYVRKQANAVTTVDNLAEIAGVTKDSLSRSFPREMGVTLKQFMDQELVRKAGEKLLSPGATARRVAEELQFSSEYYFSRFFKKHTGIPPSKFRGIIHPGQEKSNSG